MRLYVNGAQVASFAVSGALVSSSHPLQIGGDSVFGQFFNGLIDEVRVYNRALSQAEIQAAMNAPLGDISAPTAPSALTATAAGGTQINLSWTASTDNVGVTGYRVERCQGAGCGTFAQIAIPVTATFSDTGLTAGTSYSYRVRAADAAGNLSAYSNVASATTPAGQAQMYLIYADHLNTPRMIATTSGTTVWRWDQGEPFGNDVPNNNPSGTGVFDFPLRFPGQYSDKEINLTYNYFRDYDPNIGRYLQSDPIGLRGGLNTYLYVSGNPIRLTDPFGLIDPLVEKGLKEGGRAGSKLILIKPQVKEIALRCANELSCNTLSPGPLGVGYFALDTCQRHIDNSVGIPPAEKGGAIDDCLGECIRLLKKKCIDPRSCGPGDDSNV